LSWEDRGCLWGRDQSNSSQKLSIFFMSCNLVSLVVQAAGGGIAASVPLTNKYMVCQSSPFEKNIIDILSDQGGHAHPRSGSVAPGCKPLRIFLL
jgi:hypothetical protein